MFNTRLIIRGKYMKSEDSKEQLILATINLLQETDKPIDITARQISAAAGTNLAMINYYFKSKDELMTIAVGRIIESSAERLKYSESTVASPKERLGQMLLELCEMTMKYSRFTKITIPYILIHGEITIPLYILPIIREHFGEKRDELKCKVIAYQIISFLQLIFLRSDDFYKYLGIDMTDRKALKLMLDMQLEIFLGGDING